MKQILLELDDGTSAPKEITCIGPATKREEDTEALARAYLENGFMEYMVVRAWVAEEVV